jgi:hypothetical protein
VKNIDAANFRATPPQGMPIAFFCFLQNRTPNVQNIHAARL